MISGFFRTHAPQLLHQISRLEHFRCYQKLTPHTFGKCPRTYTTSWEHSFTHSDPCKGSTSIFDSYGDPWRHLCALRPTRNTIGLLLGEQGAIPLSIIFRGICSSIWHFRTLLGLWRAPQHVHIIIRPIVRLIFPLVSQFGRLVTNRDFICTLFYHQGLIQAHRLIRTSQEAIH